MSDRDTFTHINDSGIAIIGMACRFPGANTVDEFWRNLRDGVESVTFFSDEELLAAGIDAAAVSHPNYVKASSVMDDAESFDAAFFGFNPREAEIIDPQHRIFLECAWQTLEDGGYDPETYKGLIGVYAGASINTYFLHNLFPNRDLEEAVGVSQIRMGNRIDNLTTRVSYKLNLKGPSFTVQTNCSTSLVAVHLACQSLLNGECDMALAGGVRVGNVRKEGYFYQEGGILSPDGHCRAFDADAKGMLNGEGVGIVLLKRLTDAVVDGDSIYAVIKGSAINNDGSQKVGYTAPSVDGQAAVISDALALAGVDPASVTCIEAHGTGTSLGDPIEVAALKQVFQVDTKKNFCAIGSVKTNIGHTDTAAGVAGLIKAVLALKHKLLPPSLHFRKPNPEIDFANSAFYVNAELKEWKVDGIHPMPRRAGVSSFGVGGTNAHVVLEEAPAARGLSGKAKPAHLLTLSARTGSALEAMTANLAYHLKQYPNLNLADVAHTLAVGRKGFTHRRMLVCETAADAATALETLDPQRIFTAVREHQEPSVVFMFSGQGAQYVNMAIGLYQTERVFREQIDHCAELLKPHLRSDIRSALFPSEAEEFENAAEQLKQTAVTQPALFVIEYALAKLWMEWGVHPSAMIGHSIGEYTAACLAGVFSLEDALRLVALRGRLMQQLPGGAMLAVSLTESEVQSYLGSDLSLAAVNGLAMCVVSGSEQAISALDKRLTEQNVKTRRLHTSHAFHSAMMDAILKPFTDEVGKLKLKAPQIPYISNVTGTWIKAEEAIDPNYWAKHLRYTVRFADGLHELLNEPHRILLEVGPGQTLGTLARQHPNRTTGHVVLSSLPHPDAHLNDPLSDAAFVLNTLGRLWLTGGEVNWLKFYGEQRRLRVPLPTYPFERQRYWLDPPSQSNGGRTRQQSFSKKPDVAEWFYVPSWKRSAPGHLAGQANLANEKLCWLVFSDECGIGVGLVNRLKQSQQDVVTVTVGREFTKLNDHAYEINPQGSNDYEALLKDLLTRNRKPTRVVHLWSVTPHGNRQAEVEFTNESQRQGFYSLLFLAQALGRENITDSVRIEVITNNLHEVTGEEHLAPEKATVLGPCKVISQEYPNISCRSIDVDFESEIAAEKLAEQLVVELAGEPTEGVVAYRGNHRWTQTFEPVRLDQQADTPTRLRTGGVYLITGGLGNIGLTLAEYLAGAAQAKLILVGRTPFPAKNEWGAWLASHDEQDGTSHRIQKLQAIERLGAEVLILSADVAEVEQMQGVMRQIDERFGELHGVIHGAAILGEKVFSHIQETSQAQCEHHFRPKVRGLLALEKALGERALDFCMLMSSLSSVLGGLGYVAYAAANSFMDAFAHQRNTAVGQGVWTSVNWDGWRFREDDDEPKPGLGASLARLAMTPQEGAAAFARLLSTGSAAQMIVTGSDLQARIDKWIKLEPADETDFTKNLGASSLHPRPMLLNAYVEPRNEVEQIVVDTWRELLGIGQVGIYDDFFELGGHSLLGVQIVSRLRNSFRVELPLRCLFEQPTAAGLAAVIAQVLTQRAAPEKIALMLAELENLSDEEAEQLLAAEAALNN